MALLFGTNSNGAGLQTASSVVGTVSYEPVTGSLNDLSFIYKALPSFYRNLMAEQQVFSNMWSSAGQLISGDFLSLWHNDYSISAKDILTYNQRKWYKFNLFNELEFDTSSLTKVGSPTFSINDLDYSLTLTTKGGIDFLGDVLSATLTDDTSFKYEYEFELNSTPSINSGFLVGFIDTESQLLRDSLSCGLVHPTISSVGSLSLGIVHASPTADTSGVTAVFGSFIPTINQRYKITFEYFGETKEARSKIFAIDELVLTESILVTGETEFTKSFTPSNTFYNTALVGDSVSIDITIHNITSTIKGTITAKSGGDIFLDRDMVPCNTISTFKLLKIIEKDSIYLNTYTDTNDYKFSAKSFGIFNLHSNPIIKSNIGTTYDQTPVDKSISVKLHSWRYLNPLTEDRIIYLPSLQENYSSDPSTFLKNGIDFTLQDHAINFKVLPSNDLYAEFVAFDEKLIYKNFGYMLELGEDYSTDNYKRKIQGVQYSYFKGPTVQSIEVGVNLLLGLPVVENAGTVTAHNTAFSGTLGQVTVGTDTYLYPLVAGSSVQVGQSLTQFYPVCDAVTLEDYISKPDWWYSHGIHELEKYHTFNLKINMESLPNLDSVSDVKNFIQKIKPSYKKEIITLFRTEEDEVELTDDIAMKGTFTFIDTIMDIYDPRYDYELANGDYEFSFDQGVFAWTTAMPSIVRLAENDTKNAFWSEPAVPDLKYLTYLVNFDWTGSELDSAMLSSHSSLNTTVYDTGFYTINGYGSGSPASPNLVHNLGTVINTGTSTGLSHTVNTSTYDNTFTLTDSTANFSFVGTKYITAVEGSNIYYGTASVSSTTELTIRINGEQTLDGSTVTYEVRGEISTASLTIESGTAGQIASLTSGDPEVIFTDSSATFTSTIATQLQQYPGEPANTVYLRVQSGSNKEAMFQVIRVLSDTQLVIQFTNHYTTSSSSDYAVGLYSGSSSLTWTVLNISGVALCRKTSTNLSGTVTLNNENIEVDISSIPAGNAIYDIEPGDIIRVTSPDTDYGEFSVLSVNTVSTTTTITVGHDFNASGTILFDIIANVPSPQSIAFNSDLEFYDDKLFWIPILEVDSTGTGEFQTVRRPAYPTNASQIQYLISYWNTQRPNTMFSHYEYYSPNDSIAGTITNVTTSATTTFSGNSSSIAMP